MYEIHGRNLIYKNELFKSLLNHQILISLHSENNIVALTRRRKVPNHIMTQLNMVRRFEIGIGEKDRVLTQVLEDVESVPRRK